MCTVEPVKRPFVPNMEEAAGTALADGAAGAEEAVDVQQDDKEIPADDTEQPVTEEPALETEQATLEASKAAAHEGQPAGEEQVTDIPVEGDQPAVEQEAATEGEGEQELAEHAKSEASPRRA